MKDRGDAGAAKSGHGGAGVGANGQGGVETVEAGQGVEELGAGPGVDLVSSSRRKVEEEETGVAGLGAEAGWEQPFMVLYD